MKKIGLTGSIGMGKSTTAAMFAARGVPVYDADAAVHDAYSPGGEAVSAIEAAFPGVLNADGGVDRTKLRERVVGDPLAMKRLEEIIHPIIAGVQSRFLDKAAQSGADLVVLDIPLLFETGGDRRVDFVVVVTAPPDVQRKRVLARERMSVDEFNKILSRQTPDEEKRRRADFIIETGLGMEYAQAQVDSVINLLRNGSLPQTFSAKTD